VAIDLHVECYAGYRAEETPRALRLGDRRVAVVEVLDRWLAPDHRYFKLRGDDGAVYIVRHDLEENCWELSVWERQ
jgi:hypothetical protein